MDGSLRTGQLPENVQLELGVRDQELQGTFASGCVSPGDARVVEVDGTADGNAFTFRLWTQEQEFAFLIGRVSSTSIDAVGHTASVTTRLTLSR